MMNSPPTVVYWIQGRGAIFHTWFLQSENGTLDEESQTMIASHTKLLLLEELDGLWNELLDMRRLSEKDVRVKAERAVAYVEGMDVVRELAE